MNIYQLYHKVQRQEIDYTCLLGCLQDYRQPRMKIRQWLAKKELIRIKKGIYIFNPQVTREAYSREVLANWIHGPSAISLHYALSHYGLIPERVFALTCTTPKATKNFETPVGMFSYRHQSMAVFREGLTMSEYNSKQRFIIATPEKAVADLLALCAPKLETLEALDAYLAEDMRLDVDDLRALSGDNFLYLQNYFKNQNLELFIRWMKS